MTTATNEERPWGWKRIVELCLPALIAGTAGVSGAWFGGHSVLQGQRDQIAATRQTQLRAQRDISYRTFINAANDYEVATIALRKRCHGRTRCAQRSAAFGKSRHDFQAAYNDVYVRGSTAAYVAATAITKQLPVSTFVSSGDASSLSDGSAARFPIDYAQFAEDFKAFQAVMRRESAS